MKKILFVTNKPSFYRVKFFNELGKYSDLDVIFELQDQKKDKIRSKDWFNNNFKNFNAIFLSKLIRFSENYYINLDLLRKVDINKYDNIIIGQYSTLNSMILIYIMNKLKKKFILSTDGGFPKKENKLFYKIRSYFIKSANKYLSNSKKADEFLEFYGAQVKDIYRYHFTSYTSKEIQQNKKMYLNNKEKHRNYKTILCVSNFEKRKNIEMLINAWSKIENNEKNILKIIGNGTLKNKYLEQIKNLKLQNVKVIDFMPQEELKKTYVNSDALILNSKKDVWGLVISEAMTYGLPVIATKMCLAGTELIENEKNGYIIEDNEKELIEALKKILSLTEKQQEEIAKNNIQKIQKYSIEQMVEDHLKMINDI